MGSIISNRRMAENEAVFREYNERVTKGFKELHRIAKEEGEKDYVKSDNTPIAFYCECSDETCRKRILLKPSRYNEIHKHRDRFIIIQGHDVKSIEQIIDKEAAFCIVEKIVAVPISPHALNKTDIENS